MRINTQICLVYIHLVIVTLYVHTVHCTYIPHTVRTYRTLYVHQGYVDFNNLITPTRGRLHNTNLRHFSERHFPLFRARVHLTSKFLKGGHKPLNNFD
jgi:hypothetical protein